MSSFIHSAEMFNSVEHKILSAKTSDKVWELREVSKAQIQSMIEQIRSISVLCVCLQYKHHYEGVLDVEIEKEIKSVNSTKEFKRMNSLVDLIKAMNSINYQIEINHLKDLRNLTDLENDALELFDKIETAICKHIVSNLSEYDNSKWWS